MQGASIVNLLQKIDVHGPIARDSTAACVRPTKVERFVGSDVHER